MGKWLEKRPTWMTPKAYNEDICVMLHMLVGRILY